MKTVLRKASFALVLALCVASLRAQTASNSAVDSRFVLTQLANSFTAGKPVSAVQLSGTVSRYAGETPDSGRITLSASSDGSNDVRLQLSEGVITDSQTSTTEARQCQWTGLDGAVHDSTGANCWTSLVWFLPQLTLHPAKLSPALGISYLGVRSTKAGSDHVIENQLVVGPGRTPAAVTAQIQNQSTTRLYIDSQTFLPSTLEYTVLSDSGSARISVQVLYSNYQQISGLKIPTHIERYLNGGLELAIDVTDATISN